jgi:hypothetical protein
MSSPFWSVPVGIYQTVTGELLHVKFSLSALQHFTAGFTEGDPHRTMHTRDPDEGPVLLEEIAPA